MNKVLLVTTVYRVGEKIYPIIPELSKFCSIDLLRVNEMSYDMRWYGDIDPRMIFDAKYLEFIDDVYDGGFESSRLNPSKK